MQVVHRPAQTKRIIWSHKKHNGRSQSANILECCFCMDLKLNNINEDMWACQNIRVCVYVLLFVSSPLLLSLQRFSKCLQKVNIETELLCKQHEKQKQKKRRKNKRKQLSIVLIVIALVCAHRVLFFSPTLSPLVLFCS